MLRYFLSGASGIRADLVPEVASLVDYRLLSMHDAFKGNTKVWTAVSHHPKSAMKEVMLDSGAFTAFTKGHKVSLDKLVAVYDDTIRKLSKNIKHVWLINLDVIPGAYGRVADTTEVQAALDESDKNYKLLRKRYGDRVLPVFHQTESMKRLEQVAAQNWFIGMGFRQDFAEEHRIRAAEAALNYTTKKGIVVHGLATTGYRMLKRAPFDTVDSATWLYVAAMGGVLYLTEAGDLGSISISSRSPSQRDWRGHYKTVPHQEQAWLDARFADAGVTLEQLESDLSYRILFCAHQMREWMRSYVRPAVCAEVGLFSI